MARKPRNSGLLGGQIPVSLGVGGMLLAFYICVLEHTLSEDEHNQIVQTIEMFEAITQTQPDDYQSLEILKEAYTKVGRHDDSLRTSRKLAEAYFNGGSYSPALQECEAILVKHPNAPEVLAMIGEIETRLQASGKTIAKQRQNDTGLTEKEAAAGEGSLIDVDPGRDKHLGRVTNLQERGDDHLAKFLIVQQLFPEEEVMGALETVKHANKDLTGQAVGVSLLDQLCKGNEDRLDAILSALIDRTKFAYVPLEYYDTDRQIAPTLPDALTLGRLFVPFDLVSRTIMVACCNPFDSAGREAVQQSVDYTVTWYLARPAAIIKSLQSIYRLESRA
jgi:Type II secretion system (T2SS), protein E, N-terminal domain